MPSQLEVGLDALLQGAEALLFQPRDRRLRERVVGEVCKRRPAPQRERLVQPVRGSLRIRSRRLVAQPLEAVEVEPAGLDPQRVPGRPRQDHVGAERPAQLRDVDVEALRGVRRRMRAPDVLDQPVGRDDLVRVHEQHREHGARLAFRQRQRAVLADRLERPEHLERQPAGHASSLARIVLPASSGRQSYLNCCASTCSANRG